MEQLKPGRELDALIAEKVMGLEVVSDPDRYLAIQAEGGDFFGEKYVTTVLCHNLTYEKHRPGSGIATVPRYSETIAAAWEVVEKMNALGINVVIESGKSFIICVFGRISHPVATDAITVPHAICLAALKVVTDDLG